MNYQEALAYLDELAAFGVKPGLERITRLLELLDLPQNKYHIVHVTGTNGKGSVSAMLAGILQASSVRTGLFISPHLASYTERVQIDGQPISEQEFADSLASIQVYVEQMIKEGMEPPTQFEILTAMAFFCFAIHQVEYAVVEVGMGGLLDSTNVVTPVVSVITNVSEDHAQWCGGTLEGVARHKAGIIKEGVPVVTSAKGISLEIIREAAGEKASDIFVEGEDFHAERVFFDHSCQRIEFGSELLGISHESYELQMPGCYQVENSAVARMTAALLRNLDERITVETIARGLKMAKWPGRFEQFCVNGRKILLDGAHNPAGAAALRESLDCYFPEEPRVYLLGILRDKAIDGMLKLLLRPEDAVIVTKPESGRAAEPAYIADRVREYTQNAEIVESCGKALARAAEIADRDRLLIVTGSLYLIGSIRQMLLREE